MSNSIYTIGERLEKLERFFAILDNTGDLDSVINSKIESEVSDLDASFARIRDDFEALEDVVGDLNTSIISIKGDIQRIKKELNI